jgi:hypothetical protein
MLDSFSSATGMEINFEKSSMIYHNWPNEEIRQVQRIFPTPARRMDEGLKYLGFYLKPDKYRITDWLWMIKKIEGCIYV